MKIQLNTLIIALGILACALQSKGQLPVITSFSQNGVLVCSNLAVGSSATVAWASSLSGPWQTNSGTLYGLSVNLGGSITVTVPISSATIFLRVLDQTNLAGNPPQYTADGMALIPAGTFTMGDITDTNLDGDATPTNIYVSSFYMDTNLVTYSVWEAVYSYATNNGYTFLDAGAGKGPNHPVQTVNWFDCVKWSNARSQEAGLTPVYYTDTGLTHIFTNGDYGTAVYANFGPNGYRLPTEAEWEKAARGGLSGQRFPLGLTISRSQANYNGDTNDYNYDLGPNGYNPAFTNTSQVYTSPAGYFMPNGYGLYDMSGNLNEWCWDWEGTPYGQPGNINPTGPATGFVRVMRGGSWHDIAKALRCGDRDAYPPHSASSYVGFRCARSP